ncbi:MAG: alpha/beta fold hydrolase [Anaerolineae bacterium]|nr:alpha/beta fold hydrolase [Anaerolineae bacterium]
MLRPTRLSLAFAGLLAALVLAACDPAGGGGAPLPPRPTATLVPLPSPTSGYGQPASGPDMTIAAVNAAGQPVERIVDGNAVRLSATLRAPVTSETEVEFALQGGSPVPLGACVIPANGVACELPVRADGWAWENRELVGLRSVSATAAGGAPAAMTTFAVTAKPIILVHGLNSDETSWINWIKSGGYLEARGLPGYAVDDGQFGTRRMNTGIPSQPKAPTFSIAQNAEVVAEYVEAVRKNTGAERVDLVAHSLGGLISRYYVQNLMPVVEAAGLPAAPVANQLFMAGTPNGGTPCGRIPAAIGLFSPATTQITPEYLSQVFNPTVRDRRGVPFFAIAGDAVQEKVAIRCTELPTDRYVSVRSVLQGVSVAPDRISGIHSDLNNREDSFERIFASLARSPEQYPIEMEPATAPLAEPEQAQSTLVQSGTLTAGETVSVTLTIDQARSASFMLLAPGSEVSMTIKTVAGRILTEETPLTNPNVTFERVLDDNGMVSLGYGVVEPRAGAWEIGLTARKTPPGGGPFAVLATMDTDLALAAEIAPGAPRAGQPARLTARLSGPQPPQQVSLQARISGPADESTVLPLQRDGDAFAATWTPGAAGEYTIVVEATGLDAAGNLFERLAVLGASPGE